MIKRCMNFSNILFMLLIVQLFRGSTEACLCQDGLVFRDDGNFLETGFYNAESSCMVKVDFIDIGQMYGLPGNVLRNRSAQWKVIRSVIAGNSVISIVDRNCVIKRDQHCNSACSTEFPIRI